MLSDAHSNYVAATDPPPARTDHPGEEGAAQKSGPGAETLEPRRFTRHPQVTLWTACSPVTGPRHATKVGRTMNHDCRPTVLAVYVAAARGRSWQSPRKPQAWAWLCTRPAAGTAVATAASTRRLTRSASASRIDPSKRRFPFCR